MKALINYADEAYVAHMTGQPGPHIAQGVGFAIGLASMQTVQSICQHHFFYRSMMVGAQARSALISVIYRKSLVLSNKVLYPPMSCVSRLHCSRSGFSNCRLGWNSQTER
jgi:hypothetical protein